MNQAWQEYPLLEGIVIALSGITVAVLIFIAALAQGWFLWWQFRTRSVFLQILTWAWCALLAFGLIMPWLERPPFGGLFSRWSLNTILLALIVAAAYMGLGLGVYLAVKTYRLPAPAPDDSRT
jgi:hypothetical protein